MNCVHEGFTFWFISIRPELQTYSSTRSRRNELLVKPEPSTDWISCETQVPFGLSNNRDIEKKSILDSFSSKKFRLDLMNSRFGCLFLKTGVGRHIITISAFDIKE